MSSLRLERQQQICKNSALMIQFGYFSFSLIHLELKRQNNTFICYRGSLENHTRAQFQTIMIKTYTRFQTKTAQTPYPLGRHIPI